MMKKLLMAITVMATALTANAQEATDITTLENCLYIENFEIMQGCTHEAEICMKNKEVNVQTVGFYMTLPEGLSMAKDEDGADDWYLDLTRIPMKKGIPGHSMSSSYVAPDYRCGILQSTGAAIKDTDGSLVICNFQADENATPGEYLIKLSNIEFSGLQGKIGEADGKLVVYCPFTIKGGTAVNDAIAEQEAAPQVIKQFVNGTLQITMPDGRVYNGGGAQK